MAFVEVNKTNFLVGEGPTLIKFEKKYFHEKRRSDIFGKCNYTTLYLNFRQDFYIYFMRWQRVMRSYIIRESYYK